MPEKYCSCVPKIATTASRNPFTDRLVIIGDACSTRYYKNGIESAFKTAKLAAETSFYRGISRSAFKKGYHRPVVKQIVHDNFFGKILFGIYNLVYENSFLSEVLIKSTVYKKTGGKAGHLKYILWNLYTGNTPYKSIFIKFLNPLMQWELIVQTVKSAFERVSNTMRTLKSNTSGKRGIK